MFAGVGGVALNSHALASPNSGQAVMTTRRINQLSGVAAAVVVEDVERDADDDDSSDEFDDIDDDDVPGVVVDEVFAAKDDVGRRC